MAAAPVKGAGDNRGEYLGDFAKGETVRPASPMVASPLLFDDECLRLRFKDLSRDWSVASSEVVNMVGVTSGKALLSDGGAVARAPCSDSMKMSLRRNVRP